MIVFSSINSYSQIYLLRYQKSVIKKVEVFFWLSVLTTMLSDVSTTIRHPTVISTCPHPFPLLFFFSPLWKSHTSYYYEPVDTKK